MTKLILLPLLLLASFLSAAESKPKLECKLLTPDEACKAWPQLGQNLKKSLKYNEVCIQFLTSDFKPGSQHTIYSINTLEQKSKVMDVVANAKGELCRKPGKINTKDCPFIICGFMNGEAVAYHVTSSNGVVKETIVPRPIEYTWKDGANLKAILVNKEATQFVLFFVGFQPNETLITISESGPETLESVDKVNDDGVLVVYLAPGIKGKAGGSAKYTVKRQNETGTLTYLWGEAAQQDSK